MTVFSRTQLILAAALAVAVGAPALAADNLPEEADDLRIPGPPPEDVPLQRPYLPPYAPPPRYERSTLDTRPVLPPYQVVTILRTTGYAPLGPVARRGWIYTLAALDPNGDDGRLIIDARTGRVMRFIPAMAVDERLNARLDEVYGPPAPPPVVTASGYETRRGSLLDLRRSPRPPTPVPHAARRPAPKAASRSQPPAAAPQARQPVTAAPAAAQAKPPAAPRTAESQPATVGAAAASAPQPSPSAPSTLKLWPTQAMPEVQPLE